MISTTNFEAQLLEAISVLNLLELNELLSDFQRISNELQTIGTNAISGNEIPAFLNVSSIAPIEEDSGGNSEQQILYSCTNGGMIDQHLQITIGPFIRHSVDFNN